MDRVAIALGSNLGDRAGHIQFARDRLEGFVTNLRLSSLIETEPAGMAAPGPWFVNAAAVGDTSLAPGELMARLLDIERERGRERPYPDAPRTLDLDLILYGERVIHEAALIVPHPRFRERRFVLEPLEEIAPDLRDPVTRQTVRELLASLRLRTPAAEGRRP